jgi:hypothetical protein
VPFCLARIPQGSEVRGNLAAGGKGVAQPLSARDREIAARAIGPVLARAACCWLGLDVIGTKVTEINVTSPTCFQEILDQTGCDVAALFIDASVHPRWARGVRFGQLLHQPAEGALAVGAAHGAKAGVQARMESFRSPLCANTQ